MHEPKGKEYAMGCRRVGLTRGRVVSEKLWIMSDRIQIGKGGRGREVYEEVPGLGLVYVILIPSVLSIEAISRSKSIQVKSPKGMCKCRSFPMADHLRTGSIDKWRDDEGLTKT